MTLEIIEINKENDKIQGQANLTRITIKQSNNNYYQLFNKI
nr:hypothetical protein [Mycoplasmopsis bovis]